MTLYVTLCMTQNVGAIFWQKRVYDTKVYDTKCTTNENGLLLTHPIFLAPLVEEKRQAGSIHLNEKIII